jgi:hypothetical protein
MTESSENTMSSSRIWKITHAKTARAARAACSWWPASTLS